MARDWSSGANCLIVIAGEKWLVLRGSPRVAQEGIGVAFDFFSGHQTWRGRTRKDRRPQVSLNKARKYWIISLVPTPRYLAAFRWAIRRWAAFVLIPAPKTRRRRFATNRRGDSSLGCPRPQRLHNARDRRPYFLQFFLVSTYRMYYQLLTRLLD